MINLSQKYQNWKPWIDTLCIAIWGILLLKFWLTGQLNILIHPAYWWLTIVTGWSLILISCFKAWELINQPINRPSSRPVRLTQTEHITIFPPGWSSIILLSTAILGLLIEPKVFVSQMALERGINDFVPVQTKAQAFNQVTRPEERSLVEWVRTLNVYPEPDAYAGQKAKIQGFVIHPPNLPDNFIVLARFVITCCAADAYPVGIPISLSKSRAEYPPDTWLEIQGKMITIEQEGKRKLALEASAIKPIPKPENPYDY